MRKLLRAPSPSSPSFRSEGFIFRRLSAYKWRLKALFPPLRWRLWLFGVLRENKNDDFIFYHERLVTVNYFLRFSSPFVSYWNWSELNDHKSRAYKHAHRHALPKYPFGTGRVHASNVESTYEARAHRRNLGDIRLILLHVRTSVYVYKCSVCFDTLRI